MRKLFFAIVIALIVLIAVDYLAGYILFKSDTPLPGIRNYLLADNPQPRYLSQPYLNYINNPQYRSPNGEHQINAWGLRHTGEVAIPKPPTTLRILFLGGSTTYGEVDKASDAFPALLEKIIADSISFLAPNYSTVECLNAGMGAATSAELLTHYLFKYKYLDADIIVIHTGINDAFATADLAGYIYQPDYHTSKRVMENLPAVKPWMKLLSHSYIASYCIIRWYYNRQMKSDFVTNDFFEYNSRFLWMKNGNQKKFHPATDAFYNNITELVNSITLAQKKILLVTEVIDTVKMPVQLRQMLTDGVEKNKQFLLQIAGEHNLPVCILDKNDFSANMFLDGDGIHVNEEGEKLKAEKMKLFLLKLIHY